MRRSAQLGDLQTAVSDVGKGQAALSGDFKQMGQLIQESARLLKGTHGMEQIFLNVTGATQTIKQVGQNMTRLFGGEFQEMKNTTQRLEEQNASLHAKFNELESKLDRMLEILEDFNQQATPSEVTGSPINNDAQPSVTPETTGPGAQTVGSPSSTPGLQVPPYTPNIPHRK